MLGLTLAPGPSQHCPGRGGSVFLVQNKAHSHIWEAQNLFVLSGVQVRAYLPPAIRSTQLKKTVSTGFLGLGRQTDSKHYFDPSGGLVL